MVRELAAATWVRGSSFRARSLVEKRRTHPWCSPAKIEPSCLESSCAFSYALVHQRARGRLEARFRHHADLEQLESAKGFARYQGYLQAIVSMSESGTLSRVMYLAEARSQ